MTGREAVARSTSGTCRCPTGARARSWCPRPGGGIHLAHRLRRPEGEGRGYANVVARSHDGVDFTVVATVSKERFDAESLERPALAVTPAGRRRLYVSCATPGTKHWWVEMLEADTPEGLADAPRSRCCPATRSTP